MDSNPEQLVTAEGVATRFGVNVETVNRWARIGIIPCIRPSRRIVRFKLSEVERALTQTTSAPEVRADGR